MQFVALTTTLVLLLLGAAPAQGEDADPGFRAWAWLHGRHAHDRGLADALTNLGFHGVSAEPTTGPRPDRDPTDALPYYLDQLVGDDVLGIDFETWERGVERSRQDPPDLARPRCLHDSDVLEAAQRDVLERLAALGKRRPAFISLRDEPSFTRLINPIDWCDHPGSHAPFSAFLLSRWGGWPQIRSAWGLPADDTHPNTSDGVGLPYAERRHLTDEARNRYFHEGDTTRSLVAWNDARAFADKTFADTVHRLSAFVRGAMPGVPVGILGGQMPHAFGGYDWERLLEGIDVVEAYRQGGASEIVRSLAGRRVRILNTVLAPHGPLTSSVHDAWDGFIRGGHELVAYSSAELFEGGDPHRPTAWARSLAPALQAMAGPRLAAWRRSRPLEPQVAILHSMPSVRLHWILDTEFDGSTWRKRLTSYEATHSTQARTREAWIALMEDMGLRYAFVTPRQIINGHLDGGRFQALVLPRSIALSGATVDKIKSFAHTGGMVVADCQTSLFTARLDRRTDGGALDAMFGVHRKSNRVNLVGDRIRREAVHPGNPYPVAEPDIEARGADPLLTVDGHPILLCSDGAGSAHRGSVYLNMFIMDYPDDRFAHPERAAWLRRHLQILFQHGGVRPLLSVDWQDGSPRWPVGVWTRQDGNALVVALQLNLRCGSREVPWGRVLQAGAVRCLAKLPGTYQVEDLSTGQDLGTVSSVTIELHPDRPTFLRLSR